MWCALVGVLSYFTKSMRKSPWRWGRRAGIKTFRIVWVSGLATVYIVKTIYIFPKDGFTFRNSNICGRKYIAAHLDTVIKSLTTVGIIGLPGCAIYFYTIDHNSCRSITQAP